MTLGLLCGLASGATIDVKITTPDGQVLTCTGPCNQFPYANFQFTAPFTYSTSGTWFADISVNTVRTQAVANITDEIRLAPSFGGAYRASVAFTLTRYGYDAGVSIGAKGQYIAASPFTGIYPTPTTYTFDMAAGQFFLPVSMYLSGGSGGGFALGYNVLGYSAIPVQGAVESPEPSTAALSLCGLALLSWRYRRQR